MAPPKSCGGRIPSPHSSHSTWKADAKRASQAGQRLRRTAPHCGQAAGSSPSDSSKYRWVCPHDTQRATQWPSVLRRSSWIQLRFGRATPSNSIRARRVLSRPPERTLE